MEEELSDPHEQQLLAVYKSCLTKDQKELDKTGLSLLCSKLELEESQQHALMELVKVETTVSFQKFRDGFLAFLDKTLNERVERAKNGILEELENGYTCVDYKQKHKIKLEDNGNHVEIDKDYDKKLQEILNNHGSITVEGTNSFCNKDSILPKQTVELIFEKLDLDCDGLINLTEFLLFFENANSKLQEHSISNWFSQMQRAHQIKTEGLKDFGNHQTGVVSRSYITELWELGGVTEANSLLLDLGFEGPTVNLIELSNALSSELKLHHDVSHDGGKKEYIRLLKGALILYQEEVRNINTIMEHLRCERDKLRVDITEANDRANVLAQEIDEHQTRMDEARQQQLRQLEQRHCETVKELTDLLQVEREKSNENLHAIELKLIAAQVEESKIRAELVTALEDVKALEQENRNQAEEIRRLEGVKNELARQVRELAAEHEQVANLENRESEQIVELTERMRQLQTEMKVLRDQNDELNSELESLRNREHDANSVVEVRSTSDENDVPTTEVDTEDEEGKPLKRQTRTKGKSTKESQTTNSNEKLGDIIKDLNGLLIRTNFCNECDQVRSNIISLVGQLEQYRSSQLSPGRRRKQARDLANELANTTSSTRTTSCLELSVPQQLSSTNKRISSSNDTINELKLHDNMDSSDLRAYFKTKLATLPYKSSQEWKPSTEELLREVEAKHNMERRKLTDRISELERSLEKLRQEYDQCEEYWVLKLDEERQIFEQEQKENSEKFNELLDKITEYEEQYADDSVKQSTPGRLSPIEERSILEQQYSDLEEEFQRWRRHAQMQLDSREMEIQDLKSKLKGKSSVDEEVQCPDEQMKKDYPALYSMLIKSTDEPDSSTPVPTEEDKEAKKECTQCHKLISVNSECSCQTPPQQQPSTKPQNPSANQSPRKPSSYYYHQSKSHRRDDGRSSKYLHNNHRYFSQQQPHQTQYQQNQTSQQYWNDRELRNLQRQKDRLRQEIIKLQTLRAGYPVTMDEHGIFSNLCAKLYAAEQRYKYLQMFYQVQQTEQERIRQVMWKQHMLETADLRCIIKNTENKLNQQIKLYKEQTEKLTKADFLAKELYVENAQLTETIKRLEQHCQILTQDKIDTKSPA